MQSGHSINQPELEQVADYIGKSLGSSFQGRIVVSSRESLFDKGSFTHSRFEFLQIQPLTEKMQEDVLMRRFDHDAALVAPDDPAQLYFTSGTTGRAKGVVLTHANVCDTIVRMRGQRSRWTLRVVPSGSGRASSACSEVAVLTGPGAWERGGCP